jgi:mono/diheme cytochrome c family protein
MRLAFSAGLLCFSAAAAAQNSQTGRLLYETYCGQCHYERLHDRDPSRSRVKSLQDLRAQVARWAGNTGRIFTQDELADVVEYLNSSHYHF